MTVKADIKAYLARNGRSTVSEIANGTGYSTGHVRQNAKAMRASGTINGEKVPKQLPAAIIKGNFEVMSGSKKNLLNVLQKYAPHLVSKASGMKVGEIQNLIANQVADRTVSFKHKRWEFW